MTLSVQIARGCRGRHTTGHCNSSPALGPGSTGKHARADPRRCSCRTPTTRTGGTSGRILFDNRFRKPILVRRATQHLGLTSTERTREMQRFDLLCARAFFGLCGAIRSARSSAGPSRRTATRLVLEMLEARDLPSVSSVFALQTLMLSRRQNPPSEYLPWPRVPVAWSTHRPRSVPPMASIT